jgi:hypothetical protein
VRLVKRAISNSNEYRNMHSRSQPRNNVLSTKMVISAVVIIREKKKKKELLPKTSTHLDSRLYILVSGLSVNENQSHFKEKYNVCLMQKIQVSSVDKMALAQNGFRCVNVTTLSIDYFHKQRN